MKFISRTASRFNEWFTTLDGLVFRGRIEPLSDSTAMTTNFLDPRQVLHVLPNEPLSIGTVIKSRSGDVFMLADHDDTPGARVSFRLFRMTKYVLWERPTTVADVITNLPKDTGMGELGSIWILTELYGKEDLDRGLYIQAERLRVITGAAIRLNDKVDGLMVRRINTVYGITVAETQ